MSKKYSVKFMTYLFTMCKALCISIKTIFRKKEISIGEIYENYITNRIISYNLSRKRSLDPISGFIMYNDKVKTINDNLVGICEINGEEKEIPLVKMEIEVNCEVENNGELKVKSTGFGFSKKNTIKIKETFYIIYIFGSTQVRVAPNMEVIEVS